METGVNSIQPSLRDKILSIRKLLNSSDRVTPGQIPKGSSKHNPKHESTIDKWKYKPSRTRRSQFLKGVLSKRVPVYYNVAKLTSEKYNGEFELYSEDALLLRVREIKEYAKLLFSNWDLKGINPLILSSKGWTVVGGGYAPTGSSSLNFVCHCCQGKLTISVTSEEDKEILSSCHSIDCPWRRNVFDLEARYYFNFSNVGKQIEDIKSRSCNVPIDDTSMAVSCDLFRQIHNLKDHSEVDMLLKVFGFKQDELLRLSVELQGYEVIENKILRCKGCFTYTTVDKILNPVSITHAFWCKYHRRETLPRLILDLIPRDLVAAEGESLNMKLQKFINYVHKM